MANLTETTTWEPAIYQLEEEDLVQGGPDGIDNVQGKQLANRTQYLKAEIEATQGDMEAHLAATDPHTQYATESYVNEGLGTKAPLDSPALTGTPTTPTPDAADSSQKIATTAWLYSAMATVMSYFGFVISLSPNGFIKFPSILGGLILQWGTAVTNNGVGTWTYPIAFPNGPFRVFASQDATAAGALLYAVGANLHPTTPLTVAQVASGLATGSDAFFVFVIGN